MRAGVGAGIAAGQSGALAELAGPSPVERSKGPTNLLFIMSDQQRGDAMSSEGHGVVKTPRLDELGKEGVRFSHTYCQSPLCVPSRACFMTGRYVHLNRCYSNGTKLPETEYTWAEFLRDEGYTTVAVGKTHGVDDGLEVVNVSSAGSFPPGASHYNNNKAGIVHGTSPAAKEDFYDARIVDAGIEELRRFRKEGKPWALFVGIHAPHPPFYPPKPYDTMYDPSEMEVPPFKVSDFDTRPDWQRRTFESRFSRYTDEDKRQIISHYYGMVTMVDAQVGRLLDALDELGMRENTVVVYTADHGDNMGEHGLFAKFASMYEGEVRIPGIMRLPGALKAGRVVDKPIESIDMVETMLLLMGLEPPEQMQGRDLRPLVEGEESARREFVYSAIARGEDRGMMLRTERWKLCHYTDQAGELYDLEKDPGEMRNLYADAEYEKVRDELTYKLAKSQEGAMTRGGGGQAGSRR